MRSNDAVGQKRRKKTSRTACFIEKHDNHLTTKTQKKNNINQMNLSFVFF
jgi:hypothetical protein